MTQTPKHPNTQTLKHSRTKDEVEVLAWNPQSGVIENGEYDRYKLRSEPVIDLDLEATVSLVRKCNNPTAL
jgi:hypothetical protein